MARMKTDKSENVREFYIEFLRLPNPAARRAAKLPYATRQEFCNHWHIDRTTVWRWEQDPEFMRRVHNDILGTLSIDEVQRIINAQKIKAFDGNTIAAKFLLEWAGVSGAKATKPLPPDLKKEEEKIGKLSDEELLALIAEEDSDEMEDGSGVEYDDDESDDASE